MTVEDGTDAETGILSGNPTENPTGNLTRKRTGNQTWNLTVTRLGVDKVKPKEWFKYSLQID